MTTTHDELRKLAEKATPGPWSVDRDSPGDYYGWVPKVLDADGHPVAGAPANRDYIAAVSPDVVIALLDEIVMLSTRLATATDLLKKVHASSSFIHGFDEEDANVEALEDFVEAADAVSGEK